MKHATRSCISLASSLATVAAVSFTGLAPAASAADLAGQATAPVTINLWQCGSGPGAGSCMGAAVPGAGKSLRGQPPDHQDQRPGTFPSRTSTRCSTKPSPLAQDLTSQT